MKKVDYNQFWLIKDNPITKAGVFPYLGKQISPELEPDKIYQVYRPAEEIRKAADTFKLVPLVDNHTMLGKDFTPAEEKGVHGVLGEEIKEKDGVLYADVKIFSESLKNLIQNGKKELSLGYFCSYDLTPGEYHGVHYDAVQRDLKGNHIALVNNGRMGHDVRVMDSMAFDAMDLDTQKAVMADENPNHDPKTGQFSSNGSGTSQEKKEVKEKNKTKLVQLTGDELGSYKDIKELRQKAIDFYKNNLQGSKVKHPELGEILFSRQGRDEYEAFSANPDKLKMVVALRPIIETGHYLGAEPLHKVRKDGAIRFHCLENTVQIGAGKEQKVKVIVWEDDNGNKFYDLKIPKNRTSVAGVLHQLGAATEDINSIANKKEIYKGYFMKKLTEILNSATDELNLFLEEDLSSKTNGVGGKDAATQ